MTNDAKTPRRLDRRMPLLLIMPVVALAAVWIWGFEPLEHTRTLEGSVPVPAGTHTLRVRMETGNLRVVLGEAGKVGFEGRALCVVATQADLETVGNATLTVQVDPAETKDGVLTLIPTPVPEGYRRISAMGVDPKDREDTRPGVFRQIDVQLKVPADLKLQLWAEKTNLRVDTRQADTTLDVKAGNVLVMHTAAPLILRNGTGPNVVQGHLGPLDIEVGGVARATLADVTGPVRIVTRAGKAGLHLPPHAAFSVVAKSDQNVRNGFGLKPRQENGLVVLEGSVGEAKHAFSIEAYGGPVTLDTAK